MIKFTTGGFRGVVKEEFNQENISKIAQGIADYCKLMNYVKKIVISYDFRSYSLEAANLIASILSSNDIKVYLSNSPTPSPVALYMSKYLNTNLGVMITASHNPYYYNGVKVFENGFDASIECTDKLERLINKSDISINLNDDNVVLTDFLNPYFDFVKKFVNINNNNQKILFDFIHGTGVMTIPYFKEYYKLNNISFVRNERVDNFNYFLPNPTKLVLSSESNIFNIKSKNYDLIMGLDSDADRLGIIDENGNFVSGNEILALIYFYLVTYRKEKGDIIKSIATSNLIDKLALKLGFKAIKVDVGFKNISTAIIKYNALVGGESSGGLTIRNYLMGKDSTLSSLLIIEILSNLNLTISEAINKIKEFSNYDLYFIEDEVTFNNKDEVIKYAKEAIESNLRYQNINTFGSNIKYILDNDSWILLRFSGTEPVLRLFVETKSKEQADEILNLIKSSIIDK